jgi:hypothetical protein
MAPTLTFNLHSNQAQCTMRTSLFFKYLSLQHIRCHSERAIAYQVERHISLQIRSCRLDSTKFTLQMHMHSTKYSYSMISIKARSRNQCASMNRVERQSLSLTLVDDILQPMNHHHMASNAANLALLCTPMTSQNAHSNAHHSTQTFACTTTMHSSRIGGPPTLFLASKCRQNESKVVANSMQARCI